MSLIEILKRKESGWFSSPDCSDSHLTSMLRECESQQRGQMALEANQAAQAIRDEFARRRKLAEAQAEDRRHRESVALGQKQIELSQEEIAASHYSNRLSKWAIGIALFALAVAALGLYLQWVSGAPIAKSKPHSPELSASPTNITKR